MTNAPNPGSPPPSPRRLRPILMVDPRVGSGELETALSALGIPCERAAPPGLPSGDFAFGGHGPRGRALVGIERKQVPDLLECFYTGRFVGRQLIGMTGDFDLCYLIVEGQCRPDPESGALQVLTRYHNWRTLSTAQRPLTHHAFCEHLLTLGWRTPVHVIRSVDSSDTVAWVRAVWEYHSKEWGEHKSHRGFHYSRPDTMGFGYGTPSPVRLVAKEAPGIGWERSHWVAQRFKTVAEMAAAPVQDWVTIPGIGMGIARKVVGWFQGTDGHKGETDSKE